MIGKKPESLEGKERFQQEHKEIWKRYGKDLPPPSPDLQLSIVVPSSAELDNDNFWRMLRSFLHQKAGTPVTAFELLFVINNPQTAVKADRGKNISHDERDKLHRMTAIPTDKLAQRYQENQRQLQILSTVQTIRAAQDLKRAGLNWEGVWDAVQAKFRPLGLTEYELDLVRQAIVKGLALRAVDASTGKQAFKPDRNENPSGRARNIGGHVAYERLVHTTGADGLIDFLDADCFVGANYVSTLLQKRGSAHFFVKPMYSVVTEIPKAVTEFSSSAERLSTLMRYIRDHYHSYFFSYPQMSVDFATQSRQGLGGPQLTVSAQTLYDIGGYAVTRSDPDFKFAAQLQDAKNLSSQLLAEAQVFVADRQRPGSVDGSHRVSYTSSLSQVRELEVWTSTLRRFLNLDAFFAADQELGQRYRQFRAKRFRAEALSRRFFQQHARIILTLLYREFQKIKIFLWPTCCLRPSLVLPGNFSTGGN